MKQARQACDTFLFYVLLQKSTVSHILSFMKVVFKGMKFCTIKRSDYTRGVFKFQERFFFCFLYITVKRSRYNHLVFSLIWTCIRDLIREVIINAGFDITEENLNKIVDQGETSLEIVNIDPINKGPYLLETIKIDKCFPLSEKQDCWEQ